MEWKLALFLAAPVVVGYVTTFGLRTARGLLQKTPQKLAEHHVQPVR